MASADQGRTDGASLETVAEALARGPLALAQSVAIVDRVCEILESWHREGRTHGGIHPETVRFRQVGRDLSVTLDPPVEPPATYTAPEVARGMRTSERSDVYSLGLLLYHLVAGRPPFVGASDEETLQQQIGEVPASLEALPLVDVPRELDQLVRQMLAKNPNARPKGVAAIRARLENLDLDSTVMGMHSAALHEVVAQLGAATPKEEEEEGPTSVARSPLAEAPVDVLANPPVIRPPIEATPSSPVDDDVDPFADTFIRDRSALALDLDETQTELPPMRDPQGVRAEVLDPRGDPADEPPTVPASALAERAPAAASKPMTTSTAVLIGVAVFVVTLATILALAS